nr:FtsK/SpoIIIE domain-containing protein [Microlunatus antarcticus]
MVIEVDGTRREVELAQAADAATLADLVEHACQVPLPADVPLWVDGTRHEAGDLVRDVALIEGSRIGRSPAEQAVPVPGWAASLSAGLDAGWTVPVPTGRPLLIGRSPQADITLDSPSASWSHATLEHDGDGLRVRDAGSTNGTFVRGEKVDDEGVVVEDGDVIVCGGAAITVWHGADEALAPAPGTLHNLTQTATVPFNRPPRPGLPPEPTGFEPPTRKPEPPPARFAIATVAAPLLMAVVMVAVMRNPAYAMLAILSPVLVLGTTVEQRRRRKKDIQENDAAFTTGFDAFKADLAAAGATERARRRDLAPDPARTLRRAALPTTTLWQRRAAATDFLSLHAGVGNVPWKPPVDPIAVKRSGAEVAEVVDAAVLPTAPVEVDLTHAGVVGIVGDRADALAVARSLLCQAATHCGPADLTVGVFCDPGREEEWTWAGWLPHVRRLGDGSGGQWLSTERSRSESMLRAMRDGIESFPTPALLLVLDSDVLTEGRDAPARWLLGHGRPMPQQLVQPRQETQVSGIVLAATAEQLPAACTTVIDVGRDATGTVTRPLDRLTIPDVVLAGVGLDSARSCAASLARFDDPELSIPGASLPGLVRLPPLLGIDEVNAAAIRRIWSSSTRISTPLGVGENGVFGIDLVRDGPHGLVGGTTGSGKSEFLRSMVAGLAARNDPTRLTFILIDFKGGAAFKTCERLPHTIGTVSNLDEQLADRALTALEAELRYRQEMFARAGEGVDNLDAYLATKPEVPMPRLLLVIDEFAMLAKDYPDVLKSLVSVAAVGRTLGVHMILATQRPAGVVNEDILANTNLRVALRVQSRDDSTNVIGVPAAAAIGRTQWGRAYVKLGQDDISPVQTALVTGRAERQTSQLVDLHPVHFGHDEQRETGTTERDDDATDLDLLIDAIVEANGELGYAAPRPVWPEPLGTRVSLSVAGEQPAEGQPSVGRVRGSLVEFAVADDPRRQLQLPVGWDLERGNLLVLGIPGSGTTTTLSSIALTLADTYAPEDLDLLVLDLGTRELAPLADLPHTVAYVGAGSGTREQQVRFLKFIRAELERRRATPGPHRRMVVLVDGLGVLKDEYDDFEGLKLLDGLYRVISDGPDVQMSTAITTSRSKAVPSAVEEVVTQRWLFRLADPYDYSISGVPTKLAPPPIPGRCVLAETKLHAHVATADGTLPETVAMISKRWGEVAPKPQVVGQLPTSVTVTELGAPARLETEPWRLPVGIRESDLGVAELEVFEGEHVMFCGPARSGKSTLLLAVGELLRAQGVAVWGVGGRRSPLVQAGLDRCAVGEEEATALLASARVHTGRLVLLVDDAEQFADNDQAFAGLLAAKTTDLLVVAAGRSDDLRTMYSHWTKTVRKARCGVLLQPHIDFDGDLLGVTLPRRAPVEITPGRGYVISSGSIDLLQAVSPSRAA